MEKNIRLRLKFRQEDPKLAKKLTSSRWLPGLSGLFSLFTSRESRIPLVDEYESPVLRSHNGDTTLNFPSSKTWDICKTN